MKLSETKSSRKNSDKKNSVIPRFSGPIFEVQASSLKIRAVRCTRKLAPRLPARHPRLGVKFARRRGTQFLAGHVQNSDERENPEFLHKKI